MPLYLDKSMTKRFVGIEIGGTKLQIVIGNSLGKILERESLVVDGGLRVEGIRENIENFFRKRPSRKSQFSAIGVGFGGPIDWQTGIIACSHQIKGWANFNLKRWLEKLTGIPVMVDNDANVAALGEAEWGIGKNSNPLFYITMGSGVGGGLIIDGKIYHGAKPGESEIGHILMNRNGETLESLCSGWAVDQKIRRLCKKSPSSLFNQLIRGCRSGEARFLKTALKKNDRTAKAILNETAENLAFGLSHVAHLFHPEMIVLGGGLSLIGEPLRRAVEKSLKSRIMKVFFPGPKIQLSKLKEDAVPLGALCLARRKLL